MTDSESSTTVASSMAPLDFDHKFKRGAADAPVFLMLHGTGGDESDLLPLADALDPEAAVLSPRGKVLENGMPRYFRRLAEGVFDEEDVIFRARELTSFVRTASEEYKLELSRMVAVGYSNGANIAAAMLLLGLAPFQQAILFRAMVPLSGRPSSGDDRKRVLISDGRYDPLVAVANAEQLASSLRASGADVTLRFETAGHELTASDVHAAKDWLGQR